MSTEQHIDPERWAAGAYAILGLAYGDTWSQAVQKSQAVLCAADEKRRELAQAGPEGQEYAYRVVWDDPRGAEGGETGWLDLAEAGRTRRSLAAIHFKVWVERALLGTWERVEQ